MRHHNSVLHALLKRLPWDRFEELVEAHGGDVRARKLSSRTQFTALLSAQRAGAVSLRGVDPSNSNANRHCHEPDSGGSRPAVQRRASRLTS